MHSMHNQHTPQSNQISPDEEYERQRASAQKYSALRNRLGLEFRAVQQEAYESWCAWEEHMEALSGDLR